MKNISNEAREIIQTLEAGDVYIQCPCCDLPIKAKNAGLFYQDDLTPDAQKLFEQQQKGSYTITKDLLAAIGSFHPALHANQCTDNL